MRTAPTFIWYPAAILFFAVLTCWGRHALCCISSLATPLSAFLKAVKCLGLQIAKPNCRGQAASAVWLSCAASVPAHCQGCALSLRPQLLVLAVNAATGRPTAATPRPAAATDKRPAGASQPPRSLCRPRWTGLRARVQAGAAYRLQQPLPLAPPYQPLPHLPAPPAPALPAIASPCRW